MIRGYGFKNIGLLSNMEQVGLIFTQSNIKAFSQMSKLLRLVVDDVNEQVRLSVEVSSFFSKLKFIPRSQMISHTLTVAMRLCQFDFVSKF
jgi:hypothetical protein